MVSRDGFFTMISLFLASSGMEGGFPLKAGQDSRDSGAIRDPLSWLKLIPWRGED